MIYPYLCEAPEFTFIRHRKYYPLDNPSVRELWGSNRILDPFTQLLSVEASDREREAGDLSRIMM